MHGNLQAEVDSAALYRALAEAEPSAELAGVYRRLTTFEKHHAEFWQQRLAAAGAPMPVLRPG